jgi:flagellar hook-basal body complex protein FliE
MPIEFPSYPNFPQIPGMPDVPAPGGMPNMPPNGPGQAGGGTLGTTFNSFLQNVSNDVGLPQNMANDMLSGKRPFDSAELMLTMLEAERKLNTTVRIVTELVKGLKQIESVQV